MSAVVIPLFVLVEVDPDPCTIPSVPIDVPLMNDGRSLVCLIHAVSLMNASASELRRRLRQAYR